MRSMARKAFVSTIAWIVAFTPCAAELMKPEEIAVQFLDAFERKDLETVNGLFAPGALVQRARLTEAEPELVQFEATDWAVGAVRGITDIQDFAIEILGYESVSFGAGTTVSVHFRATGKVAKNVTFVNDGVDSFSLAQIDGQWRILLYNSMEKLSFDQSP